MKQKCFKIKKKKMLFNKNNNYKFLNNNYKRLRMRIKNKVNKLKNFKS